MSLLRIKEEYPLIISVYIYGMYKMMYENVMDIEYQKIKYSQNALLVSSVVPIRKKVFGCKESCRLIHIHITDYTYLDYEKYCG